MTQDFEKQLRQFETDMSSALGDAIRKPVPAKLGYIDSNGNTLIKVPAEIRDEPNLYYFSQAGGQSFVGQAFLQEGAMEKWQIRYGAPIRVRKDPISGVWEIIGLDARYAAQFFAGIVPEEILIVNLDQMSPGLLAPDSPVSMRARVLKAPYDNGNEWKFINTQQTQDFTGNINIPTNPATAKYALVQLDFDTETLSYKYGDEIVANLTFEQVYSIQKTNGNDQYLPDKDAGMFRVGYIKLVSGMTSITRNNIWTLQSYISTGGGSAVENIVIDDDGVVVDDNEVVTT